MIAFRTTPRHSVTRQNLVYRKSDHSFDTVPRPQGPVASLLINDVELEVDLQGRALCVSGYCPSHGWSTTSQEAPPAPPGEILVASNLQLTAGACIPLNDLQTRWPAYLNKEGWICLGNLDTTGAKTVLFTPNTIAVLDEASLRALWLHPDFQD
jgi:hypothetical protein